MDTILNQSRPERSKESLASLLSEGKAGPSDVAILLAPSDHGVQRNGGRAGARWAPQALLSTFKKLTPRRGNEPAMRYHSVTSQMKEWENYDRAISEEALNIASFKENCLMHIGGGHDHVLALLSALNDRPLCVLNIDAHLDTRIDNEIHSGNPFRQFDKIAKSPFTLHQLGIHPFANSNSTQQKLARGTMHILWKDECLVEAHLQAFLTRVESGLTPETHLIFSLDCDAIHASEVEAVSAPNHNGLSLELVKKLAIYYRELCHIRGQKPIWGIYEFNPIYDSVSSRSARSVASLMYDMLC